MLFYIINTYMHWHTLCARIHFVRKSSLTIRVKIVSLINQSRQGKYYFIQKFKRSYEKKQQQRGCE